MHVCMRKQASKHATLEGLLKIRCSEIASEATLGRKQNHSTYMACGVLRLIFGCSCMHLLTQLSSNCCDR